MSCNKTSICASLSRVETFLERSRLNNCDRPTPRSSGSCSFLTILKKTPQVIAAAIVCTAKEISPITWMRCILNVVKDVGQECICSIVSKLPFETAPVFPQCEGKQTFGSRLSQSVAKWPRSGGAQNLLQILQMPLCEAQMPLCEAQMPLCEAQLPLCEAQLPLFEAHKFYLLEKLN